MHACSSHAACPVARLSRINGGRFDGAGGGPSQSLIGQHRSSCRKIIYHGIVQGHRWRPGDALVEMIKYARTASHHLVCMKSAGVREAKSGTVQGSPRNPALTGGGVQLAVLGGVESGGMVGVLTFAQDIRTCRCERRRAYRLDLHDPGRWLRRYGTQGRRGAERQMRRTNCDGITKDSWKFVSGSRLD